MHANLQKHILMTIVLTKVMTVLIHIISGTLLANETRPRNPVDEEWST